MRTRRKSLWQFLLERLAGPACALGAVMLMTALVAGAAQGSAAFADGADAARDFIQTSAPVDIAGCAITDTAIAAEETARKTPIAVAQPVAGLAITKVIDEGTAAATAFAAVQEGFALQVTVTETSQTTGALDVPIQEAGIAGKEVVTTHTVTLAVKFAATQPAAFQTLSPLTFA